MLDVVSNFRKILANDKEIYEKTFAKSIKERNVKMEPINKYVSTFKRGINHYYSKWLALLREKRFKAYGTQVKYMFFEERESNVLLVSFPACAPNEAKYNYVRTLLPFKCNKLFLLDDYGANHQGCYLIEDDVERCTFDLIKKVITRCDMRQSGGGKFDTLKTVFLGSSKGGYSALNFSFLIPNVDVVIGAPQYYLGSYLDKETTRVNLQYLIGNITEDGKNRLNTRLQKRILSSQIKPETVYFHYSNVEHTYEEHVKDLLRDLKSVDVKVVEDVHNYPSHGGLKDFFPGFLQNTIKLLINESSTYY